MYGISLASQILLTCVDVAFDFGPKMATISSWNKNPCMNDEREECELSADLPSTIHTTFVRPKIRSETQSLSIQSSALVPTLAIHFRSHRSPQIRTSNCLFLVCSRAVLLQAKKFTFKFPLTHWKTQNRQQINFAITRDTHEHFKWRAVKKRLGIRK